MSTTARILVVETDLDAAEHLAQALLDAGHEVTGCVDGEDLASILRHEPFDVVLSDQDIAGIEHFSGSLEGLDAPALILLKSFGSIQDAVEAVRDGAFDYLSKPVAPDQILMAVERAIEQRALSKENQRLRDQVSDRFSMGRILSRDRTMRSIFNSIESVSETRATILIQGESGTGKTGLARAIHQNSSRSGCPFVEVNCGALPDNLLESELFGHVRGAFTGAVRDREGKFEQADGGTIFLDEIACASLELQVKLLRVLQDKIFERVGDGQTRSVDVRVIAAANRPLQEEVRENRFREDLYYRLNVVHFEIPPLRDRPGDAILLADHFLQHFSNEYGRPATGFESGAEHLIARYPWPGNVRELENSIERAVLMSEGELIQSSDLALRDEDLETPQTAASIVLGDNAPIVSLKKALEAPEKRIIERALAMHAGNRNATAAMLGINRTTLFNKMKKYALLTLDSGTDS